MRPRFIDKETHKLNQLKYVIDGIYDFRNLIGILEITKETS